MLSLDHLDDLRRIDDQLRDLHRRMDDAVKASGTTVIELFGVGAVGAAIAVGYTRDVHRFASRDRFAAYNGTAPIEMSSGGGEEAVVERVADASLQRTRRFFFGLAFCEFAFVVAAPGECVWRIWVIAAMWIA